jgi:predicted NBD/HSP70 family sugar kinase
MSDDKTISHGHFEDTSRIAQALKTAARAGRNWETLPPDGKEAVEQALTRIARIVSGDAANVKHWNAAADYLRLRASGLPSLDPKRDMFGGRGPRQLMPNELKQFLDPPPQGHQSAPEDPAA